ncbi:MAG: hypothetical protein WCR27_04150 [Eubacteriales bacterium]
MSLVGCSAGSKVTSEEIGPKQEVTGSQQEGQVPPEQGAPGAPQDGQGGQQMIDTASAAEQLGITEEVLIDALGDPNQGAPDFAAAAETLGITETELLDALGMATEK